MPNRRRLVQATRENVRDRPASFRSREAVHDIQVLALVKVRGPCLFSQEVGRLVKVHDDYLLG
jgi:hypothetical protein